MYGARGLVYKTRFTEIKELHAHGSKLYPVIQTVVKDIIASAKTKVHYYHYSATTTS